MISHHASHGLVWLDASNPTEDEIAGLIKRYDLHSSAVEDYTNPPQISKADFYKEYASISLLFLGRSHGKNSQVPQVHTVNFIVGKNFLITIRSEVIEQLEYVTRVFETNSLLKKEEKMEHAGHLFYYMIKRMYGGMHEDIINMRDAATAIEKRLFRASEPEVAANLSVLGRELVSFHQITDGHREVWDACSQADTTHLFSRDFLLYIQDVSEMFVQNREIISNTRELTSHLRASFDSLVAARQLRQSQKTFMLSGIFASLVLIILLISNVVSPEHRSGWTFGLIGIILVGAAALWYFKRMR